MIIKIISSKGANSSNFGAVKYNDNKVEKGDGELMLMKNFPSYIDKNSSQDVVSNYLKTISKQNSAIKKPQFHCAISTKGREHSKEELSQIADSVMQKMGYEKQPYLIVFHNDTLNNHVHIVSTRIDKNTGNKLDHNFENLRSQTALREVLKEKYGVDYEKNLEKLLSYKYSNFSQFEKLLKTSGFNLWKKDGNYTIAHHGLEVRKIAKEELKFVEKIDLERKKQLYSILNKYKDLYSNKVFKVEDGKNISFHSELQKQLKSKFGIDIVISHSGDKQPFGYTIIDNKTGSIFKGSDVLKMNNLFEITTDKVDKKFFDILENYNISDKDKKEVVLNYLNAKHNCDLQNYMATISNKKVAYGIYDKARSEANNYVRNGGSNSMAKDVPSIVEYKNSFYFIDDSESKIYDLKSLIGEKQYSIYSEQMTNNLSSSSSFNTSGEKLIDPIEYNINALDQLNSAFAFSKGGGEVEEEQQRKRKKRKR